MNRVLVAIALCLCPAFALAQHDPTAKTAEKRAAMKKLAPLLGEWTGSGWIEFVPGKREGFSSREIVEHRLDGMVVTIEGIHSEEGAAKGEAVHHAFGTFTPTDAADQYAFRTTLASGRTADVVAKFEDGRLKWSPPGPPNRQMRYVIEIKGDTWHEIGEMAGADGTWRQFFEMTLKRTKPTP